MADWNDDEVLKADFPRESPEERRQRAADSVRIMQTERDGTDNPNLEREIARNSKIAGMQPPPIGNAWASDPVDSQGPVQTAAPVQTAGPNAWEQDPTDMSILERIKHSVVGGLQQSIGGILQKIGETPSYTEVQYNAMKQGRPVADVEAEMTEAAKQNSLAQAGKGIAESGKIEQGAANLQDVDWWEQQVIGAAGNVATQLPTIGLSVAGRTAIPMVAGGAAQQYGQTYAEARDKGIEPQRASSVANVDAIAEGLFELLPAKFIAEKAGGPVLKTILGYIANEVPSEIATTMVQNANEQLNINKDWSWKDYGKSILDTAAQTMISAPLLAGAGAGMSRIPGFRQKEASDATQQERNQPFVPAGEENPIAAASEATNLGDIFGDQTAPSFDAPTNPLSSADIEGITASLDQIDPSALTEDDEAKARDAIRKIDEASNAPKPIADETVWTQFTAPTGTTDVAELGASQKQARNAPNYENPNQGSRLDREISMSTVPEMEGKTPRQVMPEPGTHVLGVPSEDRPEPMLRAMMETTEQLRQKWLPDSTIVLSNEALPSNSALGWHYTMGDKNHIIVPAVLRNAKDLSKFNKNTQASIFYNLTHEFGHALIQDRFFEGVAPEVVARVKDESKVGPVSQEVLSTLPEDLRAVLQEYNQIRQAIADNSLNAEQLVQTWFGPAKNARDFLGDLNVSPTAPARDVGTALAVRASQNSSSEVSKAQFKQQMLEDVFSFDEYAAEQTSRYAYAKKLDQKTPLGRFFENAMKSLRGFFADAKGKGLIAPGTAFQEWLDGLGRVRRTAQEKEQLVKNRKNAGKTVPKATPKPKAKVSKAKPKPKVDKVQHVEEAKGKLPWDKKARGMVNLLVKDGTISKGDGAHTALMEAIERNDRGEFVEEITALGVKKVNFQPNTDRRTSQLQDWKEGKFKSATFKAFFGDWENAPERASVIRQGMFTELGDGTLTMDQTQASEPAVLFMSREKFESGANTFQASTVRGTIFNEAHSNGTAKEMVPVVLNVRNPYVVSDSQMPAPTPNQLIAKGYDGIVYRDNFEGELQAVVFRPDQVRVLDDRRVPGISFEFDVTRPEGRGAHQLYEGVKNFTHSPKRLSRALRAAIGTTQALQLAQISHLHPNDFNLGFFVETGRKYVQYLASIKSTADKILQKWERMAKRDWVKIDQALNDEYESKLRWFDLSKTTRNIEGKDVPWWEVKMNQEAKDNLMKRGIDVTTANGQVVANQIIEIQQSMLDMLNETERVLQLGLAHRYAHQPDRLRAAVVLLKRQVHGMRQMPFLPQGRFGNNLLLIHKTDENGNKELVYKEAFEDPIEWERAYNEALKKKQPGESVEKRPASDQTVALMALPKDFLQVASAELGLTSDQVEVLENVLMPVKSDKALKRYEIARLGLKGASSDIMRAYSDFTFHQASVIAKLRYGVDFNLALRGKQAEVDALATSQAKDVKELEYQTRLMKYMRNTKEYVLNPPNEWQGVRSAVSLLYLWGNVKTAAMNLYGLITTESHLMAKYGLKGEQYYAKAVWWSALSINPISLGSRRQGEYMPKRIQALLDRALKEGVLEQSYAYHLASMANASNLSRMPMYRSAGRAFQHGVDLGMMPFRLTEMASRRITFLSEIQAQIEQGKSDQEAYDEAVKATNILQNDYSAMNRLPVMRGTGTLGALKPLATIFASFAQHMAFHGFGGYEIGLRRQMKQLAKEGKLPDSHVPKWYEWGVGYTARIWLLTLIMAGQLGLPGMENIMDLIETLWRKIGKKPFRQELRTWIQSIGGDPISWERGMSHNILGFDVSRSMGFGRVFPGTDVLARGKDGTPEESVGGFALDMFGPFGNLLKLGLSSPLAGGKKTWGEWATHLPGGIGNLWTSYYWSQHGVFGPHGGQITTEKQPDGTLKPRDLTGAEIAGRALGFNPTVVSQERELRWEQYDTEQWVRGMRDRLMGDLKVSVRNQDPESEQDVRKKITEWNDALPDEYRQMRIKGADIVQLKERFRKGQKLEERGLPTNRRSRGVYEDLRSGRESPE